MTEQNSSPSTESIRPLAAELFLAALTAHGVDYLFANPGTDFPPLIEAWERAKGTTTVFPTPVLVPHENLALAMAHGMHLMTGRPQAVMVHTNIGTANTISDLAILSRERAPILLAAGRTPITESGVFGGRMRQMHWGQEMFDQAGMVREMVKWDYELRMPSQAAEVVKRAFEVATASPAGPVYLMLPREPLSAPVEEPLPAVEPRAVAAAPHPDPDSIEILARWITDAQRPLLITCAAGRDPAAVPLLATFADRFAIPVVPFVPRYLNLPSSHPMHAGHEHGELLAEADLIIALEAEVPWYPISHQPPAGCRVAHIGEDPAFVRYPMRGYPSDLTITSGAAGALSALTKALGVQALDADLIARRHARLSDLSAKRRAEAARVGACGDNVITVEYASRCVADAIGDDAVVFNEYPLSLDHCPRELPGTYFNGGMAGGLGWGVGAALGAKLAMPDRLVVATVGDGTYLFTNPTASQWVADKYELPVLTVIFNNSRYEAVRTATMAMFKDGAAGRNDGRMLADLTPSPPYDELAKLQGWYGERVEKAGDLPDVLAEARDSVVRRGRPALVNVITP